MRAPTTPAAPRLHVPVALAPGAEVALGARAAAHIAALRLRAGEAMTLFNGDGGQFAGVLTRVERREAYARIGPWSGIECESPLEVTLALGLSSGERMDFALQKATELGAARFRPLITARSVVRLDAERAERRLLHWRNVVTAACEQCGRNRVPAVSPPAPLDALLREPCAEREQRLLLSPQAGARLRELPPAERVLLLVGPEGGLDAREERDAIRFGFTPVRLGPRILRTETAPLAALAALQSAWGDN